LAGESAESAASSPFAQGDDGDDDDDGPDWEEMAADDDEGASVGRRGGRDGAGGLAADGTLVLMLAFGDVGREAGGEGRAEVAGTSGRPLADAGTGWLGSTPLTLAELGLGGAAADKPKPLLGSEVDSAELVRGGVGKGGAGAVLIGGEGREAVELAAFGASRLALLAELEGSALASARRSVRGLY